MTEPKKYTMRPTRKKADGTFQMVPIGFINGHRSALASEGVHVVTPDIHRAYMSGDIDIDDYPHARKGEAPAPKKRKRKAPARETIKAAEAAELKPETETETEKES